MNRRSKLQMMTQELCGTWSTDAGYKIPASNDIQLVFNSDGFGEVNTSSESIPFQWQLSAPRELVVEFVNRKGSCHSMGPFDFTIDQRELPLGTFTVLSFPRGSFLPFQRWAEYAKISEEG